MAGNHPKRFVILPTRGFVATEATSREACNLLVKLQTPGVMAFGGAPKPFDVRVLASLRENGPKLVEMTESQAFALRVSNPGIRIAPEVRYHLATAPRIAVRTGKAAFPSAALRAVTLTVTTGAGAPVRDVYVVAFTNFAKRVGAAGRTNAKGRVSLSLPPTTNKLERVFFYAEHTAWPIIKANLGLDGKPVLLPGIELAFADSRVKAHGPFNRADGAGVKVAVIDTGVGPHDALMVAKGASTVYGDSGADFSDRQGHGTHVAGVIAANSARFVGAAAGVALHAYRVFPRDARQGASNFDIATAIDRAVQDGCDLLNLSLGGGAMDPLTDEAIKAARAQGVVCVIAAGNDAGPVANPGRHPLAICVSAMGFKGAWPKGATQEEDVTAPLGWNKSYIAAFSNTGSEIDLTGSGCGIMSTYPQNRFAVMDGTSMACPCVTGALARLLAKSPAVLGAGRDAARSDQIVGLAYHSARDLKFPPTKQGAGLRQ